MFQNSNRQMSLIKIVPINLPVHLDIDYVAEVVNDTFRIDTIVSDLKIDVSDAYDDRRNQYRSSVMLAKLDETAGTTGTGTKILGITELDLFMPILTFVFGEAQLDGPASVISSFRLRNEFYGLPENNVLLNERICKEAIHEIAHNFGLLHCDDYMCVMKSSTYVEDIDIKNMELCSSCKELLENTMSACEAPHI
ncbi:MAG: archaemetzincin family Zn-dependent metalloprotease [Candidatus Schekmanbacteria bacterium]|nr:archaemetzincin family Zn-dependent metalloprotease [Candidatus Schekmanbacteria bacterium]